MGVSIDVDLDLTDFYEDISEMKAALESLDENIDIDLGDIDLDEMLDGGEIDHSVEMVTPDDLEVDASGDNRLDRVRNVLLNQIESHTQQLSRSNLAQAVTDGLAEVEGLSTMFGDTDMDFDGPSSMNVGPGFHFEDRAPTVSGTVTDLETSPTLDDTPIDGPSLSRRINLPRRTDDSLLGFATHRDDTLMNNVTEPMEEAMEAAGEMRSAFDKLRPTMGGLYAVLATLLPVLAAAAVGVIGLGIALGGLAVATGVVGLLGALGGEADSFSGSMQQAQEKLSEFGSELFDVFEPLTDQFAPAFDSMLDTILGKAPQLRDEIRNLGGFSGVLSAFAGGAIDVTEELLAMLVRYGPVLREIGQMAGQFVESHLVSFLTGLVNEGIRSMDTLAGLARIFVSIATLVYNLAFAITVLISQLAGLMPVIDFLNGLLGSNLFRGFMKVLGAIAALLGPLLLLGYLFGSIQAAMGGAAAASALFGSTMLSSALSSIFNMIRAIPTLILYLAGLEGALYSAAAGALLLVSALTLGVAAIASLGALSSVATPSGPSRPDDGGSGFGGGPSGLGGGGSPATINVYGDADNSTIQSFRTQYERSSRRESRTAGNL